MSEWTIATLKEYIESKFITRDEAVRVASHELDKRLEPLTHTEQDVRQRDREFYPRTEHSVYAMRIAEDMERIRETIREADKPKWSNWIAAAILLLAVIAGQWTLAIRPYENRMAALEEADRRIEESDRAATAQFKELNAMTNNRIDRLYELYRDLNASQKKTGKLVPP
jgi:hypothetical protein